MRNKRRIKIVISVVLIIIAGLLASGFAYFLHLTNYDKVELDQSKVETNVIQEEEEAAFTGYTTIAMFGLDNRDIGDLGSGRSDVIMILSINNDTQEVKVISVYRDTYMNVGDGEGPEFQKANAAYAFGGPEQAVTMLNKNLDLNIDNYISFDFNAVAKAVDVLGGVTVEITDEAELNELNRVIEETNGYLNGDSDTLDSIGIHELDGVQAVAYGRIRKLDGGDYKRAQRQRIVLSKMAEKLEETDVSTLTSLIGVIMPEVQSDLSETELASMARVMFSYDMDDSRGFPFEKANKTISSVGATVIPCDLETNVQKLHEYLYGSTGYEPSETVQEYSEYMTDRTGCTEESAEEDSYENEDDFSGNAPKSVSSSTPEVE